MTAKYKTIVIITTTDTLMIRLVLELFLILSPLIVSLLNNSIIISPDSINSITTCIIFQFIINGKGMLLNRETLNNKKVIIDTKIKMFFNNRII